MLHPAVRLLLLVLTYVLVIHVVQATGPSELPTRSQSPSKQPPLKHVNDECHGSTPLVERTWFNIAWGCISTTVISAWAAMHPNIPPRESHLKQTLRRLELIFWTMVAPEMVACWALNQRLAAKKVRNVYNQGKGYPLASSGGVLKRWFSWHELPDEKSRAWTTKHGHFLIMGGFHLVEPLEAYSTPMRAIEGAVTDTERGNDHSMNKGRVTILTLELLEILLEESEFEVHVTEDEIISRSKEDALCRVIFILQTTWFIIQCIARHKLKLKISQFELTTLVVVVLNVITFFLWWDKPFGAETPVPVKLNRRLTDAERDTAREFPGSSRSKLLPKIQRGRDDVLTAIHEIIHCRSKANILVAWAIQLPFLVFLFLLSPITAIGAAFYATLSDLLLPHSFPACATHVPTFYAPFDLKSRHIKLLLLLFPTGFGIYCIGWNFSFPTYYERNLWRVASLAVTIIPIVALPIGFIFARVVFVIAGFMKLSSSTRSEDDLREMSSIVIFTIVYATARLVLLAQVLSLLGQPGHSPTIFLAVEWSKLYPHLL